MFSSKIITFKHDRCDMSCQIRSTFSIASFPMQDNRHHTRLSQSLTVSLEKVRKKRTIMASISVLLKAVLQGEYWACH